MPFQFMHLGDTSNSRIRYINITSKEVKTLIGKQAGYGDGIGTSALLDHPYGICFSPDGQFALVADERNYKIRKVWYYTFDVKNF